MIKVNQMPLPKWFDGHLYAEGGEVTNQFSGSGYKLSAAELSMYDFIMGANYLMEQGKGSQKMLSNFHKGLTWFRRVNPEAYMVLLD